jgi:hypothetical protein
MKAVLVMWLAAQGLTITLESERLTADACRAKLAEMLTTAKQSGLDPVIRYSACEAERRRYRSKRRSRRR